MHLSVKAWFHPVRLHNATADVLSRAVLLAPMHRSLFRRLLYCCNASHCASNAPERLQQGLVGQEVDVFDMIVRFVLPFELLLGLAWVDALQNAQPPVDMVTELNR